MKQLSKILVLAMILTSTIASAQSPLGPTDPSTTRIMAIGTITSPMTPEDMKTIMPKEVKATVALYLQGKIDQWWFRQDNKGVVFLLNVPSADAAEAMLEKLPLGVAQKMKFEYIPVGPLKPLRFLLND